MNSPDEGCGRKIEVARYIGSVCKLCRRENTKLFLKGERCLGDKCSFERRPYPPGQHGQRRVKFTEYGLRLREKQKARRIYGIMERQFRRYFSLADRQRGVTGENLLKIFERRLDNAVYRMGFSTTRAEGRQLVRHNHILINGKRVNIPSYLVKEGDMVSVCERSRNVARIKGALEASERRGFPSWVEVNPQEMKGMFRHYPTKEDLGPTIQEQFIVEFYSR